MSSIITNLELDEPEEMVGPYCHVPQPQLRGAMHCLPPLEKTHFGLMRQLWIRRSFEDFFSTVVINVTTGAQAYAMTEAQARAEKREPAGTNNPNNGYYYELGILVHKPLPQWLVPWMIDVQPNKQWFPFLSETGKMECPSWDLPSGSPLVGGACPAASMGQSVIPPHTRARFMNATGLHVPEVNTTVCQACYASSLNYSSPSNAGGNILRLWWTKHMMSSEASAQQWSKIIANAIKLASGEHVTRRVDMTLKDFNGNPFRPFRIHTSGDFFSHRYAKAWIDVVNMCPEYTFWAPTRSWAYPGWEDVPKTAGDHTTVSQWDKLLRNVQHKNLIVRPSGYNIGDYAPSARDPRRFFDALAVQPRTYPYAEGTTALFEHGHGLPREAAPHGQPDPRFDFQCPVYRPGRAPKGESKCTKVAAVLPDGRRYPHCRVCWIHPELRVNFMAH